MEFALSDIAFWLLSAISIAGAAVAVFTREVMRLTLGLGVFLLSIAGWFLYFGHAFLAVAQVFVYVGGVLVLILFAIMLLHRSEEGMPELTSRHALDSAVVAAGVSVLVITSLREYVTGQIPVTGGADAAIGTSLLGAYLPHFEAIAVLLLAALVAAVVIVGGEKR
jgi:NADH-quinone oxidoreductase subunit J